MSIPSSAMAAPAIPAVVAAHVSSPVQLRPEEAGSPSLSGHSPGAAVVSMAYLGPVMMSIGCFALIASVVVVCEVRDRMLDLFDKLGGLCTIGGSRRLRRLARGGAGCGFDKIRSRRRGLPLFSRLISADDDDARPFRHNLLAFISPPSSPYPAVVPPAYCRQTTNETRFSTIDSEESLPVCRSAPLASQLDEQPEEKTVAVIDMDEAPTTSAENAATTIVRSATTISDCRSDNTPTFVGNGHSAATHAPFTYGVVQIHSGDRRMTSLTPFPFAESLATSSSVTSSVHMTLSDTADRGVHSNSDCAAVALAVDSGTAAACARATDDGFAAAASQDTDEINSDSSSYYRDHVTSDSDLSTVNEVECEMMSSSSSSFDRDDEDNIHRRRCFRITATIEERRLSVDRSSSVDSEHCSDTVDSAVVDVPPEQVSVDFVVGCDVITVVAHDTSTGEDTSNGQSELVVAKHDVTSAVVGQVREARDSTEVLDRAPAEVGIARSLETLGQDSSDSDIKVTDRPSHLSHQQALLNRQRQSDSVSCTPIYAVTGNVNSLPSCDRSTECRVAPVGLSTTSKVPFSLGSSGTWSVIQVPNSTRRPPMKMSLPPASHSAVAIDDVNGSLSSLRHARIHATTMRSPITRNGKSDNGL